MQIAWSARRTVRGITVPTRSRPPALSLVHQALLFRKLPWSMRKVQLKHTA